MLSAWSTSDDTCCSDRRKLQEFAHALARTFETEAVRLLLVRAAETNIAPDDSPLHGLF